MIEVDLRGAERNTEPGECDICCRKIAAMGGYLMREPDEDARDLSRWTVCDQQCANIAATNHGWLIRRN